MRFVCLPLLLLCSSALCEPDLSQKVQPSLISWSLSDLEKHYDSEEFVRIASGEQAFIALKKPAMTALTKGTILLVPEYSEHPDNPRYLHALRTELTEFGWTTLALLPPEILPASDGLEPETYPQRLFEQLKAATLEAKQQAGYLVVLAQGTNGALVADFYAQKKLPEPDSLVLLSAYHAENKKNKQLAQTLASLKVPTLDLKQQKDLSVLNHHWQLRKQWASKENKLLYRQRELFGDSQNPLVQPTIVKEVSGWLRYQGY